MGYSKKLYNVLGVTLIIIALPPLYSNNQDTQTLQKQVYVFVYFAQIQLYNHAIPGELFSILSSFIVLGLFCQGFK